MLLIQYDHYYEKAYFLIGVILAYVMFTYLDDYFLDRPAENKHQSLPALYLILIFIITFSIFSFGIFLAFNYRNTWGDW